MFCELNIPSTSASQVETVDIKHVRHHFISRGYSAGVAAGPDTGRVRVAAGCREYNVEGRLELGTGNTQTHTKQGSSTEPGHAFTTKWALGFLSFIIFEKEFKRSNIKEKGGLANIGLGTPTPHTVRETQIHP